MGNEEPHFFSSEINTSLGRGFTIGALPTGVSDLTWGLFKGEIGEVIIYNHSVTNANFYGENAKLLDDHIIRCHGMG